MDMPNHDIFSESLGLQNLSLNKSQHTANLHNTVDRIIHGYTVLDDHYLTPTSKG